MNTAKLFGFSLIAATIALAAPARADSPDQIFKDWAHTVKKLYEVNEVTRGLHGKKGDIKANEDITALDKSVRFAIQLATERLQKLPCINDADAKKTGDALTRAAQNEKLVLDGKYEVSCDGHIKVNRFTTYDLHYRFR